MGALIVRKVAPHGMGGEQTEASRPGSVGPGRFGEAPPPSGPLLHRARAPEGRSVELPRRRIVREVGRDQGWGEGLDPVVGGMGPGRFELPTSRLSGVRSNQAELRAPKETGARPFRAEGGSGAGRTPSYGRGAAGSSFLGAGDSTLEFVISRRVSFSIAIYRRHPQVAAS